MTPGYRRESSDIGWQRWSVGLAELAHGFQHVDSVPVDDGVKGETEDPGAVKIKSKFHDRAHVDVRVRDRCNVREVLGQRWPGLSAQGLATDKWIVCRVLPLIADMGRHAGRA